jgi:hypothetical protein
VAEVGNRADGFGPGATVVVGAWPFGWTGAAATEDAGAEVPAWFAAPFEAVPVPGEFEPRSLEPDDAAEPEPELDGLVDVFTPEEEEEEEAAAQDEEVPVLAPEADPSAAALPWAVPDDDAAPVVGAVVDVLAEGHPPAGLELDDDEDTVVGAGGAGAVEPAAEEPVDAADGAENELAEDEPAEEDPAGAADEEPEELVELVPAPGDWPDVALADCPELPEVVVEAALDELEDVPLGAADP